MHSRHIMLFFAGFVVMSSIADRSYADASTEKAKSTIAAFLESLEKSKANQVPSFDSIAPRTANARTADARTATTPSTASGNEKGSTVGSSPSSVELRRELTGTSPSDRNGVLDSPLSRPKTRKNKSTSTADQPNKRDSGIADPNAATRRQSMTPITPVHAMTLTGVFSSGELPENRYRPVATQDSRRDPFWGTPTVMTKQWVADNLAHKTLYFEDIRLERHGQAHGDYLQSHLSGIRFLGDAVLFPLRYMITPSERCLYVQCEGRPGACRH